MELRKRFEPESHQEVENFTASEVETQKQDQIEAKPQSEPEIVTQEQPRPDSSEGGNELVKQKSSESGEKTLVDLETKMEEIFNRNQ